MPNYLALSIVAPSGQKIAHGQKTLEVRSWLPKQLPLKDVVIVENQHYLTQDGNEEYGLAVAIVDIISVHAWQKDEVIAAMASYWAEGYWAWQINNVRPIYPAIPALAKRKLYSLKLDLDI